MYLFSTLYQFILYKLFLTNLISSKLHKNTKIDTSFRDYGNTVFRVLQLTGFITVDYSGLMCFTINKNRLDFLQALRNQHFSILEEAKESERIYFEELGSFSDSLERENYKSVSHCCRC